MPTRNKTARKLRELKALLAGKSTLLIVLQDHPDPDALAAATALRTLANSLAGLHCSLACGGTVGRAENRALLRYLDLNLRPVADLDVRRFDLIALVDTQPGHGNNSLPPAVVPSIVIDHHPRSRLTRAVPFTDIRRHYGATSTILCEYLQQAGLVPDTALATALSYGIRSDTQDLGRDTTQADIDAVGRLYPLANHRLLGDIQRGAVPSAYFRLLAEALACARLCGRCIYADLGEVDHPDMIAEVADLLLRHEEVVWSLCWGYHQGRAILSLRTQVRDASAAEVIRRIVSRKGSGGGHRTMAGGQIPLPDLDPARQKRLDRLIRKRFLKVTGNDPATCRKLF